MADLKFNIPHAPHVALKQLESCLTGDDSKEKAIPGLGPTKEERTEKLVEEQVFYRKVNRAGQVKVRKIQLVHWEFPIGKPIVISLLCIKCPKMSFRLIQNHELCICIQTI